VNCFGAWTQDISTEFVCVDRIIDRRDKRVDWNDHHLEEGWLYVGVRFLEAPDP